MLNKPIDQVTILNCVNLFCNSCKSVYFQTIKDELLRRKSGFYIKLPNGEEEKFQKQPCPNCSSLDLYIWEAL